MKKVELSGPTQIGVGQSTQLTAVARDESGRVLDGRTFSWTSDRPAVVSVDPTGRVTGVASGAAVIAAATGGVSGQLAVTVTVPQPSSQTYSEISAGAAHTCAIGRVDRLVYCWGANESGQLGTGTRNTILVPVRVKSLPGTFGLAAGGHHTCALTSGGFAHCWGANESGQLGTGDNESSDVPLIVAPDPKTGTYLQFTEIAAGDRHTCGITNLGVYCWGANESGQLGLGGGNVTASNVPRRVAWPPGGQHVAAGGAHTCVGGVREHPVCWGDNTYGQLGIGTSPERCGATECETTPTPIADFFVAGALPGWPTAGPPAMISTGARHTCAVFDSPSLPRAAYCWGDNASAQLGNPFIAGISRTPVQIGDGHYGPIALIAAGGSHTCAVQAPISGPQPPSGPQTDCWGSNDRGQLGAGMTDPSWPTPTNVGEARAVITAGRDHACAVTTDGHAFCWGRGDSGQLGTGGTADQRRPAPVAGPAS